MKKILLLYIVFGIVLYSSANLYAQDNFEDCFNIERVKAKDEGANSREAIDLAEKICKIKFDETKQNSGDETKQNSGTVTDSTDNTISFSIDIFTGNKNIKDLDISFSTYGILLDFYITPNISFATSYFISTGEEKTTSTLSETISDNIQVPYYVDETYDTQTPYYVDETYDVQVFSHYEDETYDAQVRFVPSTNFYSNSSILYQCVFFSFDDNNNSLTYEEWDCHREIYSVRIYPGLYCADFGYSYTVEVYVASFLSLNTRTHCRNSGTSQPYYNDDQGNAVNWNTICTASIDDICFQWQYQDTYITETRTRQVARYLTETRTRQVIGGYNTVTETRQVLRYRTETKTQQVAYNSTSIFNFKIQEFSLGGRFHLFKAKQNGLDIFLGAGMAQISTDIETKTDTNLINAKGSGMGVYTEAGIKYILQNGFNIGYYMRQSSAVFELDNNENIPNTEKREWGGTSTGLTLGYSF